MLQSVHRSLGSSLDAGLIDVRGVPSGTEIQDQIFRSNNPCPLICAPPVAAVAALTIRDTPVETSRC
jgi:hypothetical protein